MMQSPRPVMDTIVVGDVTIHPSAAIAPGAIFQAAPDSQIIIGAGACIGAGAIIQAYQGVIEVESGAIVGSKVLVIGAAKIGSNACIGAEATIYNASVDPMADVPPKALLGDSSRQLKLTADPAQNSVEAELVDESPAVETQRATSPQKSVVGQVYVNNLLLTLFPHRNSLRNERNGQ